MIKKLRTPLTKETVATLKPGDTVYLSGTVFTARDAAHRLLTDAIKSGAENPLRGEVIYYAGPADKAPDDVIGSVGPTTSYRMDAFMPTMLSSGSLYSIGKGKRAESVKEAIRQAGGVHFDAIGGAGAYYKSCVRSCQTFLYPELGAEAVYKLEVEDFPLVVNVV